MTYEVLSAQAPGGPALVSSPCSTLVPAAHAALLSMQPVEALYPRLPARQPGADGSAASIMPATGAALTVIMPMHTLSQH
jgi:hypothetical protein